MMPAGPAAADALKEAIAEYASGLAAELSLLTQIAALSSSQRSSSDGGELDELARVSAARERLTGALVALEAQVRPVRQVLAEHIDKVRRMPGFPDLARLHREAEALVATIMAEDRATLQALQVAEQARRLAAHAIETGEATLAAYQRTLQPAHGTAGLIDKRG